MVKRTRIPRYQWIAEVHPGHFVSVADGEQPRGLKKLWLKLQGIEYRKRFIGYHFIEEKENDTPA
jgi:hypothetical protein